MTLAQAKTFFDDRKQQRPSYPCSCCMRTWFQRAVRTVTDDFEQNIAVKVADCLTGLIGPNGHQNLCHGCYKDLRAGRRKTILLHLEFRL
jgi:hypothetical protein